MNTGFCAPSIPFRSIHRLIQSVLPQLSFSFYRHQPIRADFSGGQITSDAGLLPLRAFDESHHLTRDGAEGLSDPRQKERVQHDAPVLLRQRLYQIVVGYEDANDADRLRHDPCCRSSPIRNSGLRSVPSPPSAVGRTFPRDAMLTIGPVALAVEFGPRKCLERRGQ